MLDLVIEPPMHEIDKVGSSGEVGRGNNLAQVEGATARSAADRELVEIVTGVGRIVDAVDPRAAISVVEDDVRGAALGGEPEQEDRGDHGSQRPARDTPHATRNQVVEPLEPLPRTPLEYRNH